MLALGIHKQPSPGHSWEHIWVTLEPSLVPAIQQVIQKLGLVDAEKMPQKPYLLPTVIFRLY